MKKKIIFLAIAFLVIGLTVVQAQDMAAFERELADLQQQLQAGKITMEQFQQKSMEAADRHLAGNSEKWRN